jgi:hypothetical protein
MSIMQKLKKLLTLPTPQELQAKKMERILSQPYLKEVPEVWSGLPFKTPNEQFSIKLSEEMKALLGNTPGGVAAVVEI